MLGFGCQAALKGGLCVKYKQAATSKSSGFLVLRGEKKVFEKVLLTGAVEARCDGVQEGVLRGQEALHHRHFHPGAGSPTAG